MRRRAFTVVELLVAVVMLTAIIVATGKIFSTASKVSSAGEATADVLQQAAVLQEQLKRDIAAICRDGYFAIQCVAVRNDINRTINSNAALQPPLLNPLLPPDAIVRCDQIVFFTAGNEVSARWAGPGDLATSGGGQQSRAARVFYGHGVQFPGLINDPLGTDPAASVTSAVRPVITGVTPTPTPLGGSGGRFVPVTPWTWWNPAVHQVGWRYGTSTQASANAYKVPVNQPEARNWVLARKAVLLSDDGGRAAFYPDPVNMTIGRQVGTSAAPSVFGDRRYDAPAPNLVGDDTSPYYQEFRNRDWVPPSQWLIPSPMLQSGWIDVASSDLGKVRRAIAPTLRLQSPLDLAGISINSISVPWTALVAGGTGPGVGAPPSWPGGSDPPAWPSGGTVVVPGANAQTGVPVSGYSSQRDRIMRGTFGIPAVGLLPTLSSTGPSPGLLGWPRAEKAVPNVDRKSEMLTSATLLTNCSTFQVDWTWEPQAGRQRDVSGRIVVANPSLRIGAGPAFPIVPEEPYVEMRGFEPFASNWPGTQDEPFTTIRSQPWFGFPEQYTANGFRIPQSQWIGVNLAQDALNSMPDVQRAGVHPDYPSYPNNPGWANEHMRRVAQWIEGVDESPQNANTRPLAVTAPWGDSVPARVYTAVFGFNQDEAYTETPDGFRVFRDDYTPWPTQIRVTCTIHDPRLVLERGREFQFVIDVPKRRKD
jgi:type II secretory pathway pseudopilin PulG